MKLAEIARKPVLDQTFYHGAKVAFDAFDPERAADGHAQEGCGFYFTSSLGEARGYAYPTGRILTARLRIDKELPLTGRVKPAEVEKLMRLSPDLTEVLENWDENPQRAFRSALQTMLTSGENPKEVFEQVWYDFYRRSPAAYLAAVATLGYDGTVIPREDGVTHVVMYNLAKVRIVESVPYTPPQE